MPQLDKSMTDSNSLSTQNDPFHQVLDDLNKIADKVRALVDPVFKLDLAVTKANGIVHDVDDLFIAINDTCKAITITRDACGALTLIPVVGEIAQGAANVLSKIASFANSISSDLQPLKKDVVDKVGAILDKVKKGLNKVQEITTKITNDVPDYTNTVTILDGLIGIARSLAKVFKGNDAADSLDKLVDEYNKIKEEVSSAVLPLAEALDKNLVTKINDFVQLIEESINSLENIIGGAIDKIKSVDSVLSPIKTALQDVEETIAPVRWVLDAGEWVFDKVLKPVIDEILEATGLESLVGKLEQELEEKLGITEVTKELKKAFNLDKITDYGTLFDLSSSSSAASVLSAQWTLLANTLASYSQHNNQGTKQAVTNLIKAIVGIPSDPNKLPPALPDWDDTTTDTPTAIPKLSLKKSNLPFKSVTSSKSAINALDQIAATSSQQASQAHG